MLSWLLGPMFRAFPALRRRFWAVCYERMARHFEDVDLPFMNYGFAYLDPHVGPDLLATDEPNRLGIQLYAHVVGDVDLRGSTVLEVGCGRGGGSAYVMRYLQPRSMVGMDLSARTVRLAAARHPMRGLRFVAGDAESLPFADGAFDAVISIESSHCYAAMLGFLREVARVLRAGGYFLFADLRAASEITMLRGQLRGSGLDFLCEHMITSHVLAALDRDSARRSALIHNRTPWLLRRSFRQFAAASGSKMYADLRRGSAVYHSWALRKRLEGRSIPT